MKNIFFLIMITVLTASFIYAQPIMPSHCGSIDDVLNDSDINLDHKQKTTIKNCVKRYKNESIAYSDEIKKYSAMISEEIKKPNMDKTQIKKLIQKKKAVEAEIEYNFLMRDMEILSLLTDEQRKTLIYHYHEKHHRKAGRKN